MRVSRTALALLVVLSVINAGFFADGQQPGKVYRLGVLAVTLTPEATAGLNSPWWKSVRSASAPDTP
jgi:hypothetical protein